MRRGPWLPDSSDELASEVSSLLSHRFDWNRQTHDGARRENVTMPDLTAQFEANRAHLRAVAYRMLGSRSEAEDAVQEAWVKLARSDVGDVNNLRGWLTTVIARVCLDMLRTRRSREVPIGSDLPEISSGGNAELQTMMGDAVGLAMLVVLETLAPAERVAFAARPVRPALPRG